MDRELENQMDRVVVAFREAANRAWGPASSRNTDPPRDDRAAELERQTRSCVRQKGWEIGSETPLQKASREYLEKNPNATAVEVCRETGIGYAVCKAVRSRFKGGA
jgi:hypothetical protein